MNYFDQRDFQSCLSCLCRQRDCQYCGFHTYWYFDYKGKNYYQYYKHPCYYSQNKHCCYSHKLLDLYFLHLRQRDCCCLKVCCLQKDWMTDCCCMKFHLRMGCLIGSDLSRDLGSYFGCCSWMCCRGLNYCSWWTCCHSCFHTWLNYSFSVGQYLVAGRLRKGTTANFHLLCPPPASY